jgi:hypothetical protein
VVFTVLVFGFATVVGAAVAAGKFPVGGWRVAPYSGPRSMRRRP